MKKIIDGVRYDTLKAEEIVCWSHGYQRDFNWCEETLYRTKSGRYFVYGKGGAESRWCEHVGRNERCGGSGIKALTPEEALQWLESRDEDVPEGCPEIAALVVDG